MKYCCKYMKELDEKEIIDYCVGNLTTLDVGDMAYPIHYCPFCGKYINGSKESIIKLKKRIKSIK